MTRGVWTSLWLKARQGGNKGDERTTNSLVTLMMRGMLTPGPVDWKGAFAKATANPETAKHETANPETAKHETARGHETAVSSRNGDEDFAPRRRLV